MFHLLIWHRSMQQPLLLRFNNRGSAMIALREANERPGGYLEFDDEYGTTVSIAAADIAGMSVVDVDKVREASMDENIDAAISQHNAQKRAAAKVNGSLQLPGGAPPGMFRQ